MVDRESNFPVSSLYYIGLGKREKRATDPDPNEAKALFSNIVNGFLHSVNSWSKKDESMYAEIKQISR